MGKKKRKKRDIFDIADDYLFGMKLMDQEESEEEKQNIKKQLEELEEEAGDKRRL